MRLFCETCGRSLIGARADHEVQCRIHKALQEGGRIPMASQEAIRAEVAKSARPRKIVIQEGAGDPFGNPLADRIFGNRRKFLTVA